MNIDFIQIKYLLSNGLYRLLSVDGTKTVEEYLNSDKSAVKVEPFNLAEWTVKVFGALLLVVALMIVVLFILRKYMDKSNLSIFDKRKGLESTKAIEVMSSSSIGANRSICIVKVESEILVLGVTPSTISFLTKLTPQEAEEEPETSQAVTNAIKNYSEQFVTESQVKSSVEQLSAQKPTVDADAFDEVLKKAVDAVEEVEEEPAVDERGSIEENNSTGEEAFSIPKKSNALDGEKALMENLKKLRDYVE